MNFYMPDNIENENRIEKHLINLDRTSLIKMLEIAKSEGKRVMVEGFFYGKDFGSTLKYGLVESIDDKGNTVTLYGDSSQGCYLTAHKETLKFDNIFSGAIMPLLVKKG